MAQLKDLIVTGPTRLIGEAYGRISSANTVPVVNSDANLQFGTSSTIATIGGVAVTAKLPAGGYQGPQGPKGTNGTNGTNGTHGKQGPQGPKGADGTNGTNGTHGKQGPQGPKGTDGTNGTNGTHGKQGPQGPNGTNGTHGKQGPQGPNGTNGTHGKQGPQGPKGTDGTNGTNGTHGKQGPQGPKGTDGTNGTNGTHGKQGPQGPKGADGTNGTNGTHGKQGPQGPKGSNGTDGKQGPQGPKGIDATGFQGPQGPKGGTGGSGSRGYQGRQGPQGPNGTNGTDGKQGPQGPKGGDGSNATGKQGPQGPKGGDGSNATGLQGPQGPKGGNGSNATGKQGPQGPKGTDGTNGTNGTNGKQGPQGPKGGDGNNATGKQGPQGPNGAQGPGLSVTPSTGTGKYYLLSDTGTTASLTSSSVKTNAGVYMSEGNLYAASILNNNTQKYSPSYSYTIGTTEYPFYYMSVKELNFAINSASTWYLGFGSGDGNLNRFNVHHSSEGTLLSISSAKTIVSYCDLHLVDSAGSNGSGARLCFGTGNEASMTYITEYNDDELEIHAGSTLKFYAGDGFHEITFTDGTDSVSIEDLMNSSGGGTISAKGSTGATACYLLGINTTTATGTGVNLTSSNVFRAGNATGSGVYFKNLQLYASSDERLKDFIGDVEVDFNDIAKIPKKYFTLKGSDEKTVQIGTSAQKLREIYPELVSGDEDKEMLAVAYDRLGVVALAAVDKLHEENLLLKKEIEELKERLNRIEGMNIPLG